MEILINDSTVSAFMNPLRKEFLKEKKSTLLDRLTAPAIAPVTRLRQEMKAEPRYNPIEEKYMGPTEILAARLLASYILRVDGISHVMLYDRTNKIDLAILHCSSLPDSQRPVSVESLLGESYKAVNEKAKILGFEDVEQIFNVAALNTIYLSNGMFANRVQLPEPDKKFWQKALRSGVLYDSIKGKFCRHVRQFYPDALPNTPMGSVTYTGSMSNCLRKNI